MRLSDDRVYELHAAVFKALGHPKRMRVIDLLRDGEECVCRLAPQVGVTEANLSQLLASLRQVGLVETRRDGHAVYYRVRDRRIFDMIDQMRAVLADQLANAGHIALKV
jgi:ArsR family transcriptional regulator